MDKRIKVKVGVHNGEPVLFDQMSERFYVGVTDSRYDTYRQAKDAIDRAQKEVKAIVKPDIKYPVIAEDNRSRILKGIHAGNGNFLLEPALDAYSHDEIYPDVPFVQTLIERKHKLKVAIERAEDILSQFRLTDQRFSKYAEPQLAQRYAMLEKEYARLVAAAAKRKIPPTLLKV